MEGHTILFASLKCHAPPLTSGLGILAQRAQRSRD